MKKVLWAICMLSVGSLARAQTAPSLGSAASFAVLGSAVTCTAPGVISGDVGATGAFTNTTGCTIAGGTPPATNAAAILAQTALNTAYQNALAANSNCTLPLLAAAPGANFTLQPGVYCAAAGLTFTNITLILDALGNANAVWVFKIPAGLTGTGFQVVMANGGQPCNVFWLVGADSTFSASTFQGNILAGGPTGSFTSTGGTLIGRVLANGAVTMTGPNIHGTCAIAAQGGGGGTGCKDDDDDRNDDDDRDGHHKKGHHHKDRHEKDKDGRDDDDHH
jgi:hypothetical protein